MSSQKRRDNRRKQRAELLTAKQKLEKAQVKETVVLEIEVPILKSTVDFARAKAYGLNDDEAHEIIMQLCVNTFKQKPLRDFEITGWGFKEENE